MNKFIIIFVILYNADNMLKTNMFINESENFIKFTPNDIVKLKKILLNNSVEDAILFEKYLYKVKINNDLLAELKGFNKEYLTIMYNYSVESFKSTFSAIKRLNLNPENKLLSEYEDILTNMLQKLYYIQFYIDI